MNAEQIHAKQLLQIFRSKILNGESPIYGYSTAADLIRLDSEIYARHLGQVTSSIDAASLVAGLPMLALHMVRKPDEEINAASFVNEWASWKDEIKSIASAYTWTIEQVDQVIRALDGLPDASAANIWAGCLRR